MILLRPLAFCEPPLLLHTHPDVPTEQSDGKRNKRKFADLSHHEGLLYVDVEKGEPIAKRSRITMSESLDDSNKRGKKRKVHNKMDDDSKVDVEPPAKRSKTNNRTKHRMNTNKEDSRLVLADNTLQLAPGQQSKGDGQLILFNKSLAFQRCFGRAKVQASLSDGVVMGSVPNMALLELFTSKLTNPGDSNNQFKLWSVDLGRVKLWDQNVKLDDMIRAECHSRQHVLKLPKTFTLNLNAFGLWFLAKRVLAVLAPKRENRQEKPIITANEAICIGPIAPTMKLPTAWLKGSVGLPGGKSITFQGKLGLRLGRSITFQGELSLRSITFQGRVCLGRGRSFTFNGRLHPTWSLSPGAACSFSFLDRNVDAYLGSLYPKKRDAFGSLLSTLDDDDDDGEKGMMSILFDREMVCRDRSFSSVLAKASNVVAKLMEDDKLFDYIQCDRREAFDQDEFEIIDE